jgi:hypothetical protein
VRSFNWNDFPNIAHGMSVGPESSQGKLTALILFDEVQESRDRPPIGTMSPYDVRRKREEGRGI